MPARSSAPVVTTTLYLMFWDNRAVDDRNGLSVAVKPSAPRLTVAFVTWLVQLLEIVEVHPKSLEVALVTGAGSICSEKVARILVPHATSFAPLAGLAASTLDAVVSGGALT